MFDISRRGALAALGGAALAGKAQSRPKGYLVENTLHMFSPDQARFPFHKNAPYKPEANSLDGYIAFVKQAGLDHTVLVQPEPYQDDESYIEYCFTVIRPALFSQEGYDLPGATLTIMSTELRLFPDKCARVG